MNEPVRLLIWDLDETYWGGTVTEGGHRYDRDRHEIVTELARRGIMSSICSRNDYEQIKEILVREGIWDYFVFPSLNWDSKGPRVASLIEKMKLRPSTVMFIDDNPMNLNEAAHFAPGLQVADPAFLAEILTHESFAGKDDSTLTRLAQYKLLEQKALDEHEVHARGGDNGEFLRRSGIRVDIDFDVIGHLDRAVELINRTNQLNFTKARLSEDISVASSELRALLEQYDVQAGLVRVRDNYGDYGFVGFYAVQTNPVSSRLLHFCFSCRTLGMGVETFVYRRIGAPYLNIVGEVLSDPREASSKVDWIAYDAGGSEGAEKREARAEKFGDVTLRGGCDLSAVAHYFEISANSVTREFFTWRNGGPIRTDHSLCLVHALDGVSGATLGELERLGYRREDFDTRVFDARDGNRLIVFSFWIDAAAGVYRHRKLGFRIPFAAPAHLVQDPPEGPADLRAPDLIERFSEEPFLRGALAQLRENYEFEGVIGEDSFKANLHEIFTAISPSTRVVCLGANDKWYNPGIRSVHEYPRQAALNAWTSDVAKVYKNVSIVDVRVFLHDRSEAQSVNHFDRMVYFRLYRALTS